MDKTKKDAFREKIVHEIRELVFLTIYIALFLNSLTIYRSLILNKEIFTFFHIGYNIVEALLLAKIILLGKLFKLGERYRDKPLIIPTVYKAAIFSFFVLIFGILEHFVGGFFEGKELILMNKEFMSRALNENAGKLLITFFVFILLFSFVEISRVFGEKKLFNLFFSQNKD